VLGIADMAELGKGRAFALRVDPEQAGARYDGITGGPHVATSTELRYCLHYRFLPEGRRGRAALWVEDTGVCSFDADSRPTKALGTLRVIDDRREKEERLLYLGSHDELTGQLNRTRLTEELTQLLSSAGRAPAEGAFLLAGVNDLTLLNETYGFDVGDEVISIVGRRIGRALHGKDCIGRFSSNKFGVVLNDCDGVGAETIAQRLMASVRDSVIDTSVGAVATTMSSPSRLFAMRSRKAAQFKAKLFRPTMPPARRADLPLRRRYGSLSSRQTLYPSLAGGGVMNQSEILQSERREASAARSGSWTPTSSRWRTVFST
jgi:diguanylate cyclase (GGDEF)-like protein